MAHVPNKPTASSSFVPWPNLDDLYDYIAYFEANPKKLLGTPPQNLPQNPVVIVGAGPAGMVAAYELLRVGIVPIVLEASNRIGGRNWSYQFPNDLTAIAEMGAMRFPPSGEVLFKYFNDFNISLGGTFPDPGKVLTQLYYEDQPYLWEAGQPAPGPFEQINTDWGNFISPIVEKIQTPWKNGDMAMVQAIWQEYIGAYKNMSFYQALAQGIPAWGEEEFNAFGALGVGSGGFGPLYEISFLELLRIIINGWEDGQVFLPNGISQLTYDTVRKPLENKSFYTNPVYKNSDGKMQSLQDLGKVFVNAQVTGISGGVGQNPQVTYTVNGGPPITIDCRSVIVATTTRSMEFMGMTLPGSTAVNQDVKKAIRNVHTTNSSKMFVRTPTKFWKIVSPPFPTIPQTIQTDELPRGVYTLDYPNTESGVVLISYTWEDDSSKLLALNTLDRYNLFKQIITTICPAWKGCLPEITDPNDTDLINIDWEAESGYYGAFKLNYPGQDVEVQTAYYQFLTANDSTQDTGVYLAGDGVSWSGGWTEGAMHTGLNAACAVIQRLGGTLYPNSPLTQEILYAY